MSDDEKISRRYRELGAEEPPSALDDAIMAAARRRPQRSYAPLAAAAVLVLAIAVTLHMQLEQPGIESSAPRAVPPVAVKENAKETVKPMAAAPVITAAPEPKPFVADQPVASARSDDSRAAESSAAGALARKMEVRSARVAAPEQQEAAKPADTPERELERIAGLRGQGRQDEADRALAEFRRRYPDYRITEEMRLRVERR